VKIILKTDFFFQKMNIDLTLPVKLFIIQLLFFLK